jgi:hypothetical protein
MTLCLVPGKHLEFGGETLRFRVCEASRMGLSAVKRSGERLLDQRHHCRAVYSPNGTTAGCGNNRPPDTPAHCACEEVWLVWPIHPGKGANTPASSSARLESASRPQRTVVHPKMTIVCLCYMVYRCVVLLICGTGCRERKSHQHQLHYAPIQTDYCRPGWLRVLVAMVVFIWSADGVMTPSTIHVGNLVGDGGER